MYVDTVPNRSSPPAVLLRESVREGKRIHKRTLANLSDWPASQVEMLRQVLRGQTLVPPEQAFQVVRTLPHGHVAAVLGTLHRLGLDQLLSRTPCRQRNLVIAMIVARILDPRSKLATARGLDSETRFSTLSQLLELEAADVEELYQAMDWLLARQARLENALAKRHLAEATLVLYDMTSTYFEGQHCPLAHLGHSRDHRSNHPQIVFGLLTNVQGCPVAVEVFAGNTADPKTVAAQITKLRDRFGLQQVVLVGDRGMITQARIRQDLKTVPGIEWITALRAPQIQSLVSAGTLQLSLFDEKHLGEITHPAYPGERLIVCRNPLLAEERRRKRQELLAATEKELEKVKKAVHRTRRPERGKSKIALRAGKVLGRYKVGKHFQLGIEEDSFHYERNQAKIDHEAALDGFYVIRTNVAAAAFSSEQVVRSYKGLSVVERAFRSLKTVDLKVRPIYHRLPDRVRAHVFICMLAYYVEWHLRQAWAPILFEDHDKAAGEARRENVVAPAKRSLAAERKAYTQRTEDGLPVHSFQTLLEDLQTLAKNKIQMGEVLLEMITVPTPLQQRAFDLLQVPYRL